MLELHLVGLFNRELQRVYVLERTSQLLDLAAGILAEESQAFGITIAEHTPAYIFYMDRVTTYLHRGEKKFVTVNDSLPEPPAFPVPRVKTVREALKELSDRIDLVAAQLLSVIEKIEKLLEIVSKKARQKRNGNVPPI